LKKGTTSSHSRRTVVVPRGFAVIGLMNKSLRLC
jgi:hypothetical protein